MSYLFNIKKRNDKLNNKFYKGGRKNMVKNIIVIFAKKILNLIECIASISANSLSMIGMYEPKCPNELIK